MNWLSGLFSTSQEAASQVEQDPVERIFQLRRGISRAAAALPEDHRELGRAATAAADEVAERVEALAPDAAVPDEVEDHGAPEAADAGEAGHDSPLPRDTARELVERLERLHFHLLQVEVQGLSPDDLPFSEETEAIREMAGELPEGR